MTVAAGRRPDACPLLPQQQGDGLELRTHGRRHAAALGGSLDLTDGSGEHREYVAAVADASMRPAGGSASARLTLAWSSHELLLWNAGHGRRGSMPHGPADGTRNVPSEGPGPANDERPADPRRSTPAGLGGPVRGAGGTGVGRRPRRETSASGDRPRPRGRGSARVNACEST